MTSHAGTCVTLTVREYSRAVSTYPFQVMVQAPSGERQIFRRWPIPYEAILLLVDRQLAEGDAHRAAQALIETLLRRHHRLLHALRARFGQHEVNFRLDGHPPSLTLVLTLKAGSMATVESWQGFLTEDETTESVMHARMDKVVLTPERAWDALRTFKQ